MYEFTGIPSFDNLFENADETTDEYGNTTRHIFLDRDRYAFDSTLDGDLWSTFDTENDAPYWGHWLCPKHLRMLTYTEGDIYALQCVDAEAYDRELASRCDLYRPAPYMLAIGKEHHTAYYQQREALFIDPERGRPYRFEAGSDEHGES